VHPAPEEIACGPHRSRINVGLREHAPAQEQGDFLSIDFVVLGFAPMDGFHVEGMPQHEGNPLLRAQIGQPVLREHTFDRDDHIITIRGNDLKKGLRVCPEILVNHGFPSLIQDADIHRPGVQIDPTIRLVLFRVELHEVSSS